jgi:hypothetical protein
MLLQPVHRSGGAVGPVDLGTHGLRGETGVSVPIYQARQLAVSRREILKLPAGARQKRLWLNIQCTATAKHGPTRELNSNQKIDLRWEMNIWSALLLAKIVATIL